MRKLTVIHPARAPSTQRHTMLLALLLLLGQALVMAHELGHAAAADEHCAECLMQAGTDAAAAGSCLADLKCQVQALPLFTASSSRNTLETACARAPPSCFWRIPLEDGKRGRSECSLGIL